jgi:hypothetical protein
MNSGGETMMMADAISRLTNDPGLFLFESSGSVGEMVPDINDNGKPDTAGKAGGPLFPPDPARSLFGSFMPVAGEVKTLAAASINSLVGRTGRADGMPVPRNWHMLSFGGDSAGLGWHMHGKSWLGLVFGRKRWHLWGPGNATAAARNHPLHDSKTWVKDVLPTLTSEQRPQMCTQVAGEVMYLPAAYAHLTINEGVAIGMGSSISFAFGS